MKFNVTFEIITEESAEFGDVEESGFIAQGVSLRGAITSFVIGPIEANEYPVCDPRWLTSYGQDYPCENRSLHFPDNMTAASKIRVCRLLETYGV